MTSIEQFLSSQFSLAGKVAVVTGGTGVLGREMARSLAAAGASVVILARRKPLAETLVQEMRAAHGQEGLAVEADVTSEQDLDRARDEIYARLGPIDILVNAAGGNLAGAVIQPDQNFFDLSVPDYQQVLNLNLTGTILPTLRLCRDWSERKRGVVVNISSMTAVRAISRVMGYSLAKSAIDNFTRWLAVELCAKYGDGIRVNAIAPGFFITEQNKKLLTRDDGSRTERGEKVIAQTPMKRFGQPNELAGALIWLCSDASAFVTGTVVSVDGGFGAFGGV